MIVDFLHKIPLDVILILIGFGVRHFLPTISSGKESQNLLKYLMNNQMTNEQQAELAANLAQTQLWIELHEQACPYVLHDIVEAKYQLKKIIDGRK